MITCDGCDTEIADKENMPVQILSRYPHKVSKDKHEEDLDLHLCTKCYRGAQEFTPFWQFIVTKKFMKERTKDMKLKPRKDWNKDWRSDNSIEV